MTDVSQDAREADTCIICNRPLSQHDMGFGVPTCRGVAVPTFRSRKDFEAHIRSTIAASDTEAMRLLLEARIDLDLARNRLQACTVAAITAGMHREQYEWGEWTDEASRAVTRIDTLTSAAQDGLGDGKVVT